MLMSRRSAFAVVLTALGCVAGASPSIAQQYPTKPIRMIVGFAAGGLTDVLARLVAAEMSKTLGQQVVVENVGGAGGNIGTAQVVRAKPDGYTILFGNVGQIAINPHTYKNMDFNPLNDLEHIGGVGDIFLLMAVNRQVPANNVAEFVALAKSKPDQLNYFTSAPGGLLHVVTELFKQKTGTSIKPIHYKGSGQALPEFLAGETQLGIEALPVLAAYVKEGRLKGLMVTSKERSAVLPDVPTAAEAGYPDFLFSAWFGVHTTKGTPPQIVDKLADALHAAVKAEAVQKKMTEAGTQPIIDTPAQFLARIKSDDTQFAAAAKAANITIE